MTGSPERSTGLGPVAPSRAGIGGSLVVRLATLAGRLPEGPLTAAADASGELWYRVAPAKRAQARANLQRVCGGLAETGRGSARARRAATDPDALERLVRASFRHAARYYLEVARAGSFDLATASARLDVENRAEVETALTSGSPVIIVGMHFGSIELPVVYLSGLAGRTVMAPMEMVENPALREWFVTSRSRVGVDIIPLADARRPLLAALRGGESIGLVADRDITGTGLPTPFFGHPAPIPAGPAMLALETGAPIYVSSARRMSGGRYLGRMVHVPTPETGTRRQRITALTNGIAAAFENVLADAPEQWWGAFHPIWPDLVTGDAT